MRGLNVSRHNRPHQPTPKAPEPEADPPIVAPSEPAAASVEPEPVEAVAVPEVAPVPVSMPSSPRFVLGGLGTLQCDGVTYHPGDALPFSVAQLAALGIAHLAVEA